MYDNVLVVEKTVSVFISAYSIGRYPDLIFIVNL